MAELSDEQVAEGLRLARQHVADAEAMCFDWKRLSHNRSLLRDVLTIALHERLQAEKDRGDEYQRRQKAWMQEADRLRECLQAAEARVKDLERMAETDAAHRAYIEALDRQIAAEERLKGFEDRCVEAVEAVRKGGAAEIERLRSRLKAVEAERDEAKRPRRVGSTDCMAAPNGECACSDASVRARVRQQARREAFEEVLILIAERDKCGAMIRPADVEAMRDR